MGLPLYNGCLFPENPGDGHKGMWFEKCFNRYNQLWELDETCGEKGNESCKKNWIDTVGNGPCGEASTLKKFSQSQQKLCTALSGRFCLYNTTWHFTTGLGNPHPVENGFSWHPTLGVPYLPGSAVKGLVRAWVENWMDCDDRYRTLYQWFGSEDKNPEKRKKIRTQGFVPPTAIADVDTQAGGFIFFDAIPVETVLLGCDVMTPHYGEWYEKADIPGDWHSPVPIPFLVAKNASFLFSIAPRKKPQNEQEKKAIASELKKVMNALTDALQYLGAGAKASVGYGLLQKEALSDLTSAEKWLKEIESQLKIDSQPKSQELIRSKRLAEEWRLIQNSDLKAEVLAMIRQAWGEELWSIPTGRSCKQAKHIYEADIKEG